mgnify:FL=1
MDNSGFENSSSETAARANPTKIPQRVRIGMAAATVRKNKMYKTRPASMIYVQARYPSSPSAIHRSRELEFAIVESCLRQVVVERIKINQLVLFCFLKHKINPPWYHQLILDRCCGPGLEPVPVWPRMHLNWHTPPAKCWCFPRNPARWGQWFP